MKVKKEVKLVLDGAQLEHIMRSYFGFSMDGMKIGVVSGQAGDHDYREYYNCPTLIVKAIKEVETS